MSWQDELARLADLEREGEEMRREDPFQTIPPRYDYGDESGKSRSLPIIDFAEWKGEPPARRSLWGDWLPVHQTTMLTGAGGVGKSLFDQSLCTAIALGLPYLGMPTTQRKTLYVTCEDDPDELWRRQYAICAALDVSIDDLSGKLILCSMTGETQTALASYDLEGKLQQTDRWAELYITCREQEVGLYAFDNATDAMAGDLNDISQVAQFVNLLTGLAMSLDGAAMIIHHPNKKGEDWLGSVAWHNKVRSRLLVEQGDEDDPDARVIRNPKANYGPTGGAIEFRWHRGAFVRTEDLSPDFAKELAESIRVTRENEIFLTCLRARMETAGREVGPSPGSNYAPARFAEMTEAKGLPNHKLARAMERLFHIGAITTKQVKREGKGSTKTIIVEADPTAPEPAPERAPTTFPERSRTSTEHPPAHPPYTTYIQGAATKAAAPDDVTSEDCPACDGAGCEWCRT